MTEAQELKVWPAKMMFQDAASTATANGRAFLILRLMSHDPTFTRTSQHQLALIKRKELHLLWLRANTLPHGMNQS